MTCNYKHLKAESLLVLAATTGHLNSLLLTIGSLEEILVSRPSSHHKSHQKKMIYWLIAHFCDPFIPPNFANLQKLQQKNPSSVLVPFVHGSLPSFLALFPMLLLGDLQWHPKQEPKEVVSCRFGEANLFLDFQSSIFRLVNLQQKNIHKIIQKCRFLTGLSISNLDESCPFNEETEVWTESDP